MSGRRSQACAAGAHLRVLLGQLPAPAELRIAAAANLRPALEWLARDFAQRTPEIEIKISYGSTGKIAGQIRHGAPFDLFFAADEAFPQALADEGFGAAPERYARGRLALWLRGQGASPQLEQLADAEVRRIAIANPKHAPYGQAALQTLQAAGLHARVRDKLVMAENVGQAAHFAHSGAAEAALLAQSLLLSGELAGGRHVLIDESLHAPLWQSALITLRGELNPQARAFLDFVLSPAGRQRLHASGFGLP
jgi:molybdate transport system substrate-binding protein